MKYCPWLRLQSDKTTLHTSVRLTVKNLAQMRFSEWCIIGLAHRYGVWLQLKFEVEIVKVGFVRVKFNIVRIVIFYSNLAET